MMERRSRLSVLSGRFSVLGMVLLAALMAVFSARMANGEVAQGSRAQTDANIPAALACGELTNVDFMQIPGALTTVTEARIVPAQGSTAEYCSVTGYVQPQIQFEIRLPTKNWNGRYLQTGCGGLCGNIPIEQCADALDRNFAVAAQNMGHVGDAEKDPIWGSDPNLRIDYGDRSTHVVSIAAKAIITRYYGSRPAFSYFRGCSTGGREGLSEAEKHPEDFDGIVSGDPAFPGTAGTIAGIWDARLQLTRDGKPVLSEAKLQGLHAAVLKKCPALDGITDGDPDPRACRFDLSTVACPSGQDRADCLTPQQLDAARKVYDGPRNSSGERLFPGYDVLGSEISKAGNGALFWMGNGTRSISEGYLKYLAFPTNPPPSYTMWDLDFDKDIAKTEATAALYDPVAPHRTPDLREFRDHGGKLILYHGWADSGISPLQSLDYFGRVVASEGGPNKVGAWFRVFMIAGMSHCRGGNVPDKFDMLSAVMEWVEHNKAPNRIVARQIENGKVVRSRPLFPYPTIARYKGRGDRDDAANWEPRQPPHRFEDKIDWIWAPQ